MNVEVNAYKETMPEWESAITINKNWIVFVPRDGGEPVIYPVPEPKQSKS